MSDEIIRITATKLQLVVLVLFSAGIIRQIAKEGSQKVAREEAFVFKYYFLNRWVILKKLTANLATAVFLN